MPRNELHVILAASILILGIWLYLLLSPGRFWLLERQEQVEALTSWPSIAAVIPARNEAPRIGVAIESTLEHSYPGGLRLFVVNDRSEDGTGEAARKAVASLGAEDRVTVIDGAPLPAGWVGKVWAMHQGAEAAAALDPDFILLCDADVEHGDGVLRDLASRAVRENRDLVSLMVRLRCKTAPEKLMIPAFVFFFRLLYPFRRINDSTGSLAGAAGGTMLVRRSALERIGGIGAIRGQVIDDCSLARAIKRGGHSIWLGMAETSLSTREYGRLREIVRMISRTAYTELGHSPVRLSGCVAGLFVTFLAPPLLAIFAHGWPSLIGGVSWITMCCLYIPMLRFYRRSMLWAPLLPVTASVYLWATLVSAWRHYRGGRGAW
jgi:hopene-associated glycosyltransferase HpnB